MKNLKKNLLRISKNKNHATFISGNIGAHLRFSLIAAKRSQKKLQKHNEHVETELFPSQKKSYFFLSKQSFLHIQKKNHKAASISDWILTYLIH